MDKRAELMKNFCENVRACFNGDDDQGFLHELLQFAYIVLKLVDISMENENEEVKSAASIGIMIKFILFQQKYIEEIRDLTKIEVMKLEKVAQADAKKIMRKYGLDA